MEIKEKEKDILNKLMKDNGLEFYEVFRIEPKNKKSRDDNMHLITALFKVINDGTVLMYNYDNGSWITQPDVSVFTLSNFNIMTNYFISHIIDKEISGMTGIAMIFTTDD